MVFNVWEFLGFYSIKNAYISLLNSDVKTGRKKKRHQWFRLFLPNRERKEREEYLNAKRRIAEIKELEARKTTIFRL